MDPGQTAVYLLTTIVSNTSRLEQNFDKLHSTLDECQLGSCESCYSCDNMHRMFQCEYCLKFWCFQCGKTVISSCLGEISCCYCVSGNVYQGQNDVITPTRDKIAPEGLQRIVLEPKILQALKRVLHVLYEQQNQIKLRCQRSTERIQEFNNM